MEIRKAQLRTRNNMLLGYRVIVQGHRGIAIMREAGGKLECLDYMTEDEIISHLKSGPCIRLDAKDL